LDGQDAPVERWDPTPARPFRAQDSLITRVASGRTRLLTSLLAKAEEDELSVALRHHRQLTAVARAFETHVGRIDLDRVRAGGEQEIISVDGCRLIEQRKGARVTVRSGESRSSSSFSSSRAGIRVGGVSVSGGSGTSSRTTSYNSVSISYPPPDVLQPIDAGTVRLTTRRLAFIGEMFARNTDFRKMLGWSTDDERSLLIAPENRSKVWIVELPSNESRAFLQIMLMAADAWRGELGGILDNGYGSGRGTEHPLVSVLAAAREEIVTELEEQMDVINAIASSRGLPPSAWRDQLDQQPMTDEGPDR